MASPAASRRKGADNESALLTHLRERDWNVERLHLAGAKDEGDLVVRHGVYHFLIEAKAEKTFNLSGYMLEAQRERINYMLARGLMAHEVHGLVVLKRPRRPLQDAYVIRTLADEEALWSELVAR